MTLPLYGLAVGAKGFARSPETKVMRLRSSFSCNDPGPSDAALIFTTQELQAAVENGFATGIVVGDGVPDNQWRDCAISEALSLNAGFAYLSAGDVVAFHPITNRFRSLYRRGSKHNFMLVTERCNHYCLMCSQPPKDIDDRWILDEIKRCIPLLAKETVSLGFTGGEPLLSWNEFIEILTLCRENLPSTAIHVLSNGRAFSDPQITDAWAAVRHHDLMVGIPVYSAIDHIHDYVVQAQGAFHETLLGIMRLKDRGQRVEVRVVLHAITAPRILETCKWMARNLPFVDHVALMGLENTGFAIANDKLLWIDPADYASELAAGVEVLAAAGTPVSIYNLPRCVLPRSVWPLAVQSISDWKNGYAEECSWCFEKADCSGFFTSGRTKFSRALKAINAAN
ncbi:His-Xaa-Ser system radical SAM maturase HxsC [Rhodoplanes sp. Z2-YC6860]|uniref:His-Xaa-Ser system radical SAM maturase HxsC n=1 Tax=Rhodoplanes sp. Z2-YC6860 TaxID=674703 RepID=UPI00078C23AE|nr:His-Xaa-Ser system radical SAM maturase HxsC [Rhodoplanes sp. Z2-YC6860]AMN40422.1 Radical SAM domain protein [Rhodoplanes sp. Z2-YC6860]